MKKKLYKIERDILRSSESHVLRLMSGTTDSKWKYLTESQYDQIIRFQPNLYHKIIKLTKEEIETYELMTCRMNPNRDHQLKLNLDDKPKILVGYICTGKYNDQFKGFYESFQCKVEGENGVQVFSDKLMDIDTTMIDKGNGFINQELIENKPWPLTALLKFHYIRRTCDLALKLGYSHVFYFNANVRFKDHIKLDELCKDTLAAVPHHAWIKENKCHLKFTFGVTIDPKSKAYIEGNYVYHNSGIFGGPVQLMIKACDQIIEWTNYDLAHNRIPMWHDESYWNKFIHEFPSVITTLSQNYSIDDKSPEEYEILNRLGLTPKICYGDSSATQADKDKFFIHG